MKRSCTFAIAISLCLAAVVAATVPSSAQAPKSGGHLNLMQREDLSQGFAIHETSTIATSFPSMPCFNNLVVFDQSKRAETVDNLVGELAEKWSWQDSYRNLVFFLRKDVKWHDGQPFTSKDVKFTFDMVREAPEAAAKLRINPRKDWYTNVEKIEAPDPYTVVFHLKRPQPGLLVMLASGYSPVYAAHVNPATYRTGCIGTGPFKVKEWRKGEFVDYVKNPDYFAKGRPYLDSLRYVVIKERGTRTAALQAGQLDVSFPGETTKTAAEQLKKAVPGLVITPVAQAVSDNIILNTKKPPFDNPKVRLAVSYAIDRRALISTVHQGGAVPGASQQPKPYGVWGLLEKDLQGVDQVVAQAGGVRAVVDVHVGRALDDRPAPAAVLGLVVHARERFAVHVDGRRSLDHGEVVGPAAHGVDSQVVLPRRALLVHEHVGRCGDDGPDPGVRAGRTAVRIGVDLSLVSEASGSGHGSHPPGGSLSSHRTPVQQPAQAVLEASVACPARTRMLFAHPSCSPSSSPYTSSSASSSSS